MNSRQVSFASTFIAFGAVTRILLGNLALASPAPMFGILIKVGLTEALAVCFGVVFGEALGFLTGFLIIGVSDLFMVLGPWTPFIGAIIGILGFIGGLLGRRFRNPTPITLGLLAVPLTILSELLQNAWVAWFYNTPFIGTMVAGLPSLVAALVNNVILFSALGPRIVGILNCASSRGNISG